MATAPPATPARAVPFLGTPLPPELERLARAWIRYVSGDNGAAAADGQLRSEVARSPSRAWMIVTRLVELAGDRETSARIGAGPLEWTLEHHAEDLIARLERAVLDGRMGAALEAARPRRLPAELEARIDVLRRSVSVV